jgi:threonine dehydratase
MLPREWIEQAAMRIEPYVRVTPLTYDEKRNFYYKWENCQVTGSFKARGALNKIIALDKWEQQKGLVTASAGNHGQGVALAGMFVRTPVMVFASEHAVTAKLDAIRGLGARVRLVVGGYAEAEEAAIKYAAENDLVWVSPYNDGQVIAGQGTIGLEVIKQIPLTHEMTIVVPVGGGGLASGIGAALTGLSDRPRLIAVQSDASRFMHDLYQRGSQEGVVELPSLADGLSGAVEQGSMTIPLVRQFVDDFVLVTEAEIAHAIAFAWKEYEQQIEGSAAAAIAAILNGRVEPPAVAIVSGGNIQPEIHAEIVARYEGDI